MGLTAIDLGFRGAASGVFLLIVLVALQRRAVNQNTLLGIAMCAGGVFYAIVTAPFFPKASWWWTMPFVSSLAAVFWLWARAAFDDDFVLRRWHGALWLAVVAWGFAVSLSFPQWPALARSGGKVLSLVVLGLALAAAIQTVKTWRVDLVMRRRRLRLAVLAINVVTIAPVAVAAFADIPVAVPGASGSLPTALSLFVVATLAALGVLSPPVVAVSDATAAIASGDAGRPARVADRAAASGSSSIPGSLARSDPAAASRPSDDRGANLPAGRPCDRRAGGAARRSRAPAAPGHQRRAGLSELQCVPQSLPHRGCQAGAVRCDATGGPGADHRHGCRLPVDRTLQSRLQGRDRRDPDRIPARGAEPAGNRLRSRDQTTQPRREIG